MGTDYQAGRRPAMERILDVCVAIDATAVRTYAVMSRIARAPELKVTFGEMQGEEEEHLKWWIGLRTRLRKGELFLPWDDVDELADHLESVLAEIRESIPDVLDGLDDRELLLVAMRIEFFALEPAITELTDFVEGTARSPHDQYDEHLERLMLAIEREGGSEDRLSGFLVRVLRRTWHNSEVVANLAMRDSLTGLLNRRALSVFMAQALAAAARYEEPIAVLMMDVDDFKTVNDRYGHETGDAALKMVSQAIEATVRDSDLSARFGGDEFVIVAPNTESVAAYALAQRLEARVASAVAHSAEGADIRVTLSIGVATFEGGADTTPSADAILSRADHDLYRAKSEGRARRAEAAAIPASESGSALGSE